MCTYIYIYIHSIDVYIYIYIYIHAVGAEGRHAGAKRSANREAEDVALYYTVLYHIILYYTILYHIILY